MYSKSLSDEENLVPISNPPRTWVPYMSTRDCSQGFCSSYCPQWCYIIFPPPPPFDFPNDDSSPNFSPLVIAIIGILASAFLLVSYYAIVSKYCGNGNASRRRENHQDDSELEEDHDPSNHEPWNVSAVGLDEALIKSITVFKYKKGDGLSEGTTDCSVCLSEFQDDESLRLLPKCSHAFHVMCIDTWLKSHSNCPLCRSNIIFVNGSPSPLPPPIMETPPANESTQQSQQENDIEMGVREEEAQEEQEEEVTENRVQKSPIADHVNQEVRRSISMDYTSQGCLSIADILRIDHDEDEDCQTEDHNGKLRRDAGTSKQDNSEEMSSRRGIRNSIVLHCVASPMVMKRSLSSGRFFSAKRGRGQNMVIPLSNI